MATAKYKAEQIIPMLRGAEVEIRKGKSVMELQSIYTSKELDCQNVND